MNHQAVSRTGAWRWGLLFGLINGVLLNGASLLLVNLIPGANEPLISGIDIFLFGISLLFCGLAGYFAARQSGSPATGNAAGLYAGLVYTIISGPLALLLLHSSSQLVRNHMTIYVVSFACGFGVYLVLALVAGVIGGSLAQRNASRAS